MEDVVVIGVSDRSLLWRDGSIVEADYEGFVARYASLLAKYASSVMVTPDDGVYTDVAQAYAKNTGKKAVAFYPDQDTYYGFEHLKPNFDKFDTRPIGGDWYMLNADLTKQAKTVICLGFSPGVLIELAYVKYHQKYGGYKDPSLRDIRVLVDSRCISAKLPLAFSEQIANLDYYDSFESLEEHLQS